MIHRHLRQTLDYLTYILMSKSMSNVFDITVMHLLMNTMYFFPQLLVWRDWHTVKYGDPYSEFVLFNLPIQSAHTHTHREHTPGAVGSYLCCGARGAVGGSVPFSRAPQSWFWRWKRALYIHSPTYNSCQTWDSNSQPLDYESDSLTGHEFPNYYM